MANEDKATRYHRLRRQTSILATSATTLVLVLLLVTGGATALRDRVGAGGPVSVVLYVLVLLVLFEAVSLPFAFHAGVTLERRYGLSTQSIGRWWIDRAKATAIGGLFVVAAGLIVNAIGGWLPGTWWIATAAVFTLLLVGLAKLAPVVLLPIFHDFKPLDRPALVERLIALARRANADVMGVFEWRLSDRTRKANAALAGIGRTRRILLSDTLLAGHSDDEVEVILAHELAHHVHRDIWTGLALEAAILTAGFYAAHVTLGAAGEWLGVRGASDVAALPVIALVAGAVSLALTPLMYAVSRAHERRADRVALELTGNADAFTSAMRRLSATNLAEEQPSQLVVWLFHSHPSTNARIAAAAAWAARQSHGTRHQKVGEA
jgi:STE24 endopeptidase